MYQNMSQHLGLNYCVQAGCATVAILLHYFFLTSFMWMLMEGIVLYIMLVQVFAHINWRYYTIFALMSYGKVYYTVHVLDVTLKVVIIKTYTESHN